MVNKLLLHDNYSEGVVATVSFFDRTLALDLDFNSYGNYTQDIMISITPDKMEQLGQILIQTAQHARKFYKENP